MRSLAAAWPDRISEARKRDGDWMVRIDDAWFAWASGRLLPESQAGNWRDFAAMPFFVYPGALPPLPVFDAQAAAALRQRVRDQEKNPPRRSEAFLSALLGAPDRTRTEAVLVRMEAAGYSVTVHRRIAEPLARVSDELALLAAADPEVRAFLRGLKEINGYNYRFVEVTRTRSLHSYGLAVDLIPRSYGGRHAYWQWAMDKVPDWWTIPYDKRWMLPPSVVAAFERQGFIWGGKWLFFDTMHFEYRPEVLVLNRESAGVTADGELGS